MVFPQDELLWKRYRTASDAGPLAWTRQGRRVRPWLQLVRGQTPDRVASGAWETVWHPLAWALPEKNLLASLWECLVHACPEVCFSLPFSFLVFLAYVHQQAVHTDLYVPKTAVASWLE